jgi:hypothetical protein
VTHPVPPPVPDPRQVLVHQFIRLFGHVPTEVELERYSRARRRLSLRLPGRMRRGAAHLIARW